MKNPFKKKQAKEELLAQVKQQQKVEHEKGLAKLIWPFIAVEGLTIYDAQTALAAASGFVAFEVQRKTDEFKVSDLTIDLSKEGDSAVKQAVVKILDLLKDEKADLSAKLLERFSKTLGMYSANQYMKNKMEVLKLEDIIAQ